jgi:hypothetical protein
MFDVRKPSFDEVRESIRFQNVTVQPVCGVQGSHGGASPRAAPHDRCAQPTPVAWRRSHPGSSWPTESVGCARERDQAHGHSYGAQFEVCRGVQVGRAPGARGVVARWRRTAGQALDRALMLGGLNAYAASELSVP